MESATVARSQTLDRSRQGDDRQWTLMAVMDTLPPELASKSGHVLDVLRAAITMTAMNICALGNARDAGSITADQAVDVAMAGIMAMGEVAR